MLWLTALRLRLTGSKNKEKATLKYTCAACGVTFNSDRSDEDAKAEFEENFGSMPGVPPVVICDDCYCEMMDEPTRGSA
jgi:hypothetical protein